MENNEVTSKANFEKIRARILEIVSGFNYNKDDIHFVLAYGNHDSLSIEGTSCDVFDRSIANVIQNRTTPSFKLPNVDDLPENGPERTTPLTLDSHACFNEQELWLLETHIKEAIASNKELSFQEVTELVRRTRPGILAIVGVKFDLATEIQSAFTDQSEESINARKAYKNLCETYDKIVEEIAIQVFSKKNSFLELAYGTLTKLSLYRNCLIQ